MKIKKMELITLVIATLLANILIVNTAQADECWRLERQLNKSENTEVNNEVELQNLIPYLKENENKTYEIELPFLYKEKTFDGGDKIELLALHFDQRHCQRGGCPGLYRAGQRPWRLAQLLGLEGRQSIPQQR